MAYDNPAKGMSPADQRVMDEALRRQGVKSLDDEQGLDQFNQALRSNPEYRAYLTNTLGVRGELFGKNFGLSDSQRKRAEAWVRANVGDIEGLEIDPAGNVNDNQGFSRYAKDWKTYAAIAAGATGLGAAGIGPLAGVMGASGAGASAGGSLGGLYSATPAAIASQGVSAGAAATGAGGSGILGTIGSIAGKAGKVKDLIGGGADAMGAASDTMAGNRSASLSAEIARQELDRAQQNDYRNYSVVREQDRRASGDDAFRNVQRAEYLANAQGYMPKAGTTSYGFGPKASTDAERQAAAQFLAEQQKRLNAPDSLLPTVNDPGRYEFDPKLTKPGKAEQVLGYGGLFARLAGLLK